MISLSQSLHRGSKWIRILRILRQRFKILPLIRSIKNPEEILVQVENTNICNFHCAYCPTHSPTSTVEVSKGHMSLEDFQQILEDHPKSKWVVIQGEGEPLLDPGLFDKIKLARARGLFTQVISNGSLLREAMIKRLCQDGPDLLLFSLDLVAAKRNEELRRGLDFEKVTEQIAALSKARERTNRRMLIGLLSILHQPFDDEASAALKRYNALGLDILFYKALNGAFKNKIKDYVPESAGSIPRSVLKTLNYPVRSQTVKGIKPCPQLRYNFPYYLWDRKRTPCCVLNDPRYSFIDYTRERLLELYPSSRMPAECESCSYFGGYS